MSRIQTRRSTMELDFVKRTCDPCKFENAESKAQGFCRMCREYLCEQCEQFHRKFQATRSHKIVHGVLMPKPVKKTMTTCEYHGNNVVEFFCKDHADVICRDCKEVTHGFCRNVVSLQFFQSTDIDKGQIEKLTLGIRALIDDFRNVLALRRQDKIDIDNQKEKCIEQIRDIRSSLNTILDTIEQKLQEQVNDIHREESKTMTEHTDVCEKSITELEQSLENVSTVKKTENNLATFSTFKKAQKKLKDYANVIKDVKREAQTVNIDIEPDEAMVTIMEKLNSFGIVKCSAISKTFYLKLKDLKNENMRVVETTVHSVRMSGDDEGHDCEITGSTFLQDGSLIVCDKHNQTCKHLDRHFACKQDIKLDGAPWDVAEVNANWVITTLPFEKKLLFLHTDVEEGFRKGRSIKTNQMCWGIAVSSEEIFVTCHENPGHGKIYVFDKRGHNNRVIDAEAEGASYLFELPSYLAISAAADKIFVADGDMKCTITCLEKKTGDIIYDYSVSPFGYSRKSNVGQNQNPWSFKILVDEDDYVLANLGDKDMIQVITDEGEKFKTLLRNTEELYGPHTMSYRESDATLIIGLWDQVQSFRFKEMEIKT